MVDENLNWINAVGQQPDAHWLGSVRTTVALTLLGTPDGDVTSTWSAGDEQLHAEPVEGAAINVSIAWKDAQAIAAGKLMPAVAYMQQAEAGGPNVRCTRALGAHFGR